MSLNPQVSGMDGVADAMALAEVKGRSLWVDARIRFFRNKAAVGGLFLLGVPSFETGHYFGTDASGRDLYARVVQGTAISMMVGLVGALVAVVVGTLYGATAGYYGGRIDNIMMRTVDVLMSIPFMFVLILMLVIFGRSIVMLFVGIGLISWLDMARIARGRRPSRQNYLASYCAQFAGYRCGLCHAAGAHADHLRKLHQFPWPWRAGT